MASLRVDPLAKGYAQMLLDFPVAVPEEWLQLYALGQEGSENGGLGKGWDPSRQVRSNAAEDVAADGIAGAKGAHNPSGPWRKIGLMLVKGDDGAG